MAAQQLCANPHSWVPVQGSRVTKYADLNLAHVWPHCHTLFALCHPVQLFLTRSPCIPVMSSLLGLMPTSLLSSMAAMLCAPRRSTCAPTKGSRNSFLRESQRPASSWRWECGNPDAHIRCCQSATWQWGQWAINSSMISGNQEVGNPCLTPGLVSESNMTGNRHSSSSQASICFQ